MNKIIFFVTLLAISPLSLATDETTEFHYQKGAVADPSRWASIKAEWGICGKGRRQSPINLSSKIARIVHNSSELLQTYYKPVEATLKNRGHDMMVTWKDDAGKIVINGTDYKLVQSHWHAPSEHFLDGQKMALELHMVHKSAGEHLAVIGILFREGPPNAFISRIMDKINSISEIQDGEASIGVIDPREFGWDLTRFYEYRGSLTTPPCTEDVIWTIVNKVGTISREQIIALVDCRRQGFEANARPAQPLYERVIFLNEQATPAGQDAPATPTTPSAPPAPVTPVTPATPTTQGASATPTTPATPATPSAQATPTTPITPPAPTTPVTPPAPDAPNARSTLSFAEAPDAPDVPQARSTLSFVEAPDAPDVPQARSTLSFVEAPDAPDVPQARSTLSFAEAPDAPDVPQARSTLSFVEASDAPDVPQARSTLSFVEAPDAPDVPQARSTLSFAEAPDAPDVPQARSTLSFVEAPDAPDVPQARSTLSFAEAPDAPDVPQARSTLSFAEAPDAPDVPQARSTLSFAEAPDAPDVPQARSTLSFVEAPDAPDVPP